MSKVFVLSDFPVPSGFGRIAAEVFMRLAQRGHEIIAAGLPYDGLLPPQYDGKALPFWVAALGGKPWPEVTANLIGLHNPDVVIVLQDFPYSEQVRYSPVDWSKYAFIVATPCDGVPYYPNWLKIARLADGVVSISQFGVDAFKAEGVPAILSRPGINPQQFYPLTPEERAEARGKLGIESDAFVMGMMAQNQGRKAVPMTMKAFFDFAQDKPTSRLLLDMEKMGGWDLTAMIEQQGWDAKKVIFREDTLRAGVTGIRQRFGILDAHAVLSFREGYGLPLAEAMACGVVSIAQDYCSGPEICGGGRGILIPSVDYFYPSSWGNALDMLPDYRVMTEKLQWLYDNPLERAAMAERGRAWAVEQTWNAAADAFETAITRALDRHKRNMPAPPVIASPATSAPQTAAIMSPDGIDNKALQEIRLIERPSL